MPFIRVPYLKGYKLFVNTETGMIQRCIYSSQDRKVFVEVNAHFYLKQLFHDLEKAIQVIVNQTWKLADDLLTTIVENQQKIQNTDYNLILFDLIRIFVLETDCASWEFKSWLYGIINKHIDKIITQKN